MPRRGLHEKLGTGLADLGASLSYNAIPYSLFFLVDVVGLHPYTVSPAEALYWSTDSEAERVRELLYNAARHYRRGKALAERGDVRGALAAYEDALRDLHAVKPQRMRDVLLAHVHLSRYQVALQVDRALAESDLRLGYSYARSTREPAVRDLAEELWTAFLRDRAPQEVAAVAKG